MKLLITGGAGFIGSAVIRHIINNTDHSVVNVDKLTYAGNLESLTSVENDASDVVTGCAQTAGIDAMGFPPSTADPAPADGNG